MGLFDRILGKGKTETAAPVITSKSDPVLKPTPAQPASGSADAVTAGPAGKKGILRKFESGLRRAVDGYVDKKADALLDDATRRAEEFRQETLELVQDHAMQLLDVTEQRIDKKLQEIEAVLEERLRAEMRMRLRALIWTLVFVLLMALVSVGYVWFKRQAGLDNAPATNSAQG